MAKYLVIGTVGKLDKNAPLELWKGVVTLSSDDKDLIYDYDSLLSVVNADQDANYRSTLSSIDAIYKL